jgi:sugar O-acyltransferase (sialic acid O-acetyltransferase NeuD family)
MQEIAVFGASGFGREVMPVVRQQIASAGTPARLSFVDDAPGSSECNGHPVFVYSDWLAGIASGKSVAIAIANSQVREKLAQRCAADGVKFLEIRHPSVVQFDDVQIGEGAILCPFVTLTSNIRIGQHFHANIYSYVAHDCQIGDYVTFAPAVKCNGNVVVEDHAYIGTGAVIKQGQPGKPIVIGRGAVVGMGAVVTKSVPAGTTVVGNPARAL